MGRERVRFDYAIIRVVPHVERQEFVNVGVLLFCKARDYLDTRIDLSLERLKALSPGADADMIRRQLEAILLICRGGAEAGEFATWTLSERFHWLVAPSSTVVQMSPVHGGLCEDPQSELEQLYVLLVG